jgi:hypothetical protein
VLISSSLDMGLLGAPNSSSFEMPQVGESGEVWSSRGPLSHPCLEKGDSQVRAASAVAGDLHLSVLTLAGS